MGATSNCLWWALNGVSLQFACSKCGTTVRESPYTDTILLSPPRVSTQAQALLSMIQTDLLGTLESPQEQINGLSSLRHERRNKDKDLAAEKDASVLIAMSTKVDQMYSKVRVKRVKK